ncbi:hypothetical protein LFL96_20990 [Paraburkholderia sp. D15]|uniref:hypothetical protein n=1 Tax=Paraburkholderia sp. D15 TaxID=2880218 RepID=UPI00247AFEED|nr:hypothetical protein [Paraburkholderia sp. D15]WGS53537.1 hypothetical protein LFL96_20990 [Paraburkholderia sp. D15]
MIRRFDAFYRRHPRIATAIMICACFIALYVADGQDKANTATLRLQMWSSTGRGV